MHSKGVEVHKMCHQLLIKSTIHMKPPNACNSGFNELYLHQYLDHLGYLVCSSQVLERRMEVASQVSTKFLLWKCILCNSYKAVDIQNKIRQLRLNKVHHHVPYMRRQLTDTKFEDVYDGLVYRRYSDFSNPNSVCHLHSTMMVHQNLSHLGVSCPDSPVPVWCSGWIFFNLIE